ncbi:ferritin-like domain-containing protein [Christiangramia forsetii]|uniref:Ferritin-like domain-containing protein n=2 Tax=Christiangramia forsetii TaxID=411153 RepID=A0M2H1_CHRFK|nr:ferritin-like domain-containing protein [Christiangramia forsetii]GGG39090.1 hypothetical protein GCM10011532_23610 [Christiangramia forsetii]CAL66816.1 conserved hypothetical protein [Christiangramia forsetii KT0803]
MNIIKFLENISDPEVLNARMSRRNTLNKIKNTGKDLALVSIPFAMAATSKNTSAATMSMASAAYQASPTEVLNFALTLEYLERNFYQMGIDSGVIPEADRDVFGLILDHEKAHVNFLVAALGDAAVGEPNFDFSAGLGLMPFDDYNTFLALSQGFEDTGVRAYKGQAGALANDDALLEYALQIHSVEARHASQVRRMRGSKGWITFDNHNLGDAFDPIYAGEANTTHLGINLSGEFPNFGGDAAVTEAFDEPLTMAEVNAIAGLFIA